MPCRPRIIDAVFGLVHCATRKALQPEDPRKMDAGRHLWVELQANKLPFAAGSRGLPWQLHRGRYWKRRLGGGEELVPAALSSYCWVDVERPSLQ
jgi:hypothetical protein